MLLYLKKYLERTVNIRYRQKRFDFFKERLRELKTGEPITILDIGGTQKFWESMQFTEQDGVRITLLNTFKEKTKYRNFTSLQGNACDLSAFGDKTFDVIFSNSVIEHLFTKENQQQMAREVRRVGRNYYVQTPNYFFPIEPHWLFPLFQYLPLGLRVFLTRKLPLGRHAKDAAKARQLVKEVRLLSAREMRALFPEGAILKEKFLGLNKSITMYHFPK